MEARLIRIAARRNVALWLWPPIVAIWLLFAHGEGLDWDISLWPNISEEVRLSVLIFGPCMAGVAAWMAGREHRCGLDDLLVTTPLPAFQRRAATWAGTAAWGLVAYVVSGAVLGGLAIQYSAWGEPMLWPILTGLLAVPAYVAIGCAVGAALPNRLVAPFIAYLALIAELLGWFSLVAGPSPLPTLAYLSPAPFLDASVWYGMRPDVTLPEIFSALGLSALGLGCLALRDGARGLARRLVSAGLILVALGAAAVLAMAPPSHDALGAQERASAGIPGRDAGIIPYTPICSPPPTPVCMHPAYRSFLPGDAATINRLVAPLRGLPGTPLRAQLTPGKQGIFGSTLDFILSNAPTDSPMPPHLPTDVSFFGPVIHSLVSDSVDGDASGQPAQEAIGIWLARQAGLPRPSTIDNYGTFSFPYVGSDLSVTSAAARRFAALSPPRRHAWLAAHYLTLRHGSIPLRDLP